MLEERKNVGVVKFARGMEMVYIDPFCGYGKHCS